MHGSLPLHQARAGPGCRPITISFVREVAAGKFLGLFSTAVNMKSYAVCQNQN
jgi:hypothetical protein